MTHPTILESNQDIRRAGPIRQGTLVVLLIVFGGMYVQPSKPCAAQESPQSKPADATIAKAPEAPTVESIQSRIKQIQEQIGLDDALKAKIVEIYNNALADLTRTDEWSARIAEFQKQQETAPGTIEQMKELAVRPVPEATISIPANAKLQDLEQKFAQADAELKTLRDRMAQLDEEIKNRPDRIKALPDQIAQSQKELDDITNGLIGPVTTEEPPEQAAAKRIARLVRGKLLEREIAGLKFDLNRTDFITALRDWTAREVSRLDKISRAWQTVVNDRRRQEAERAVEKAKDVEESAAQSHPIVAEVAKEIAALAKERTELAAKIELAGARIESVNAQASVVSDRASTIASTVEAAGLSPQLALVLRRYRDQLPNVRELKRRLVERRQEMAKVEVRIIELNEQAQADDDIESEIRERIASLDPKMPKPERIGIKRELRELFTSRKKFVTDLKNDYDAYFEKIGRPGKGLVDLQQELVAKTEAFAAFINERILWIRSTAPPDWNDIEHGYKALRWLVNPEGWRGAWNGAIDTLRTFPIETGLTLVLFLILIGAQPRIRSAIRLQGESVSKSYAAAFTPTLQSFLLTVIASLPGPLLLWTAGAVIGSPYDASDFGRAIARGLDVVALPYFAIELLRQTCRRNGLAAAHFHWPAPITGRIHRTVSWLILLGLPMGFIAATMDWTQIELWIRSLGRTAFVIGEGVLGSALWYTLHPVSGALSESSLIRKHGWRARFTYAAFYAAVALPAVLIVLSEIGFHYTAVEIAVRFNRMLWLLLALVILYGLGLRWLLVSRRKLAIHQARQRRTALEAEQAGQAGVDHTAESPAPLPESREESEMDLTSLNEQTRAILRGAMVLSFLVGFWLVWVDVIPALRIFDRVHLWSATITATDTIAGPDGQPHVRTVEKVVWITLTDLAVALLCFFAAVVATRNLPGLLEISFLRKLNLGPGERYAVTTLSKYVITVLGIVLAFNAIGIGWAEVQWLAAAITVGLGFGLQEIFANFVSGLIILFERPIRVGDIVTVNGIDGRVTRIQMRATTVMNWDRKELIIPNREFVTGQVINWTLTDEIMRIVIDVGVAYGSDTRLARDLILKAATSNSSVLPEPPPRVIFKGFGASSLDFQLRCFVNEPDEFVDTSDALHYAIDDAFRQAGIEIAFPQMDVHLRDVPRDAFPSRKEC